MFQFFVMMTASVAAAWFAVAQVGGLDAMVAALSTPATTSGGLTVNYLNLLPDFTNNRDLAVAVFIMPLAVQWWAVWYPGSEPGGGSYIAQRMLASRSEKDSLGAVLFFNIAHYVLRPWPWILVALCSLIVFPQLSDIQAAFPDLNPQLLGNDIAYPAMLKFLPMGLIGLMVGGLIAAYSSTMLTHLNWGASYLVHDCYRRFVRTDADERHYVAAGRWATVGLFAGAAGLVFLLDTAKDAFDIILQVGAGTGLLYLLRWFWWRITAWCEVVAMVSSFAVSVALLLVKKSGTDLATHSALLITVTTTTVCWLLTAFLGPQTERATLIAFCQKVRPFGPGWTRVRREAGLSQAKPADQRESIPLALLGWSAGCALVWSGLFMIGNFLYGRVGAACVCLGVVVIAGAALLFVVRRQWTQKEGNVE
jgi:Na+/proline symporter